MADRALALVMACALMGCADANPLLLDTVCNTDISPSGAPSPIEPCIASGDVTITTGVSRDVMGVRFGPSGQGEFRIRLNAIGAVNADRWTMFALVASTRPEGSTLFRSMTFGSCGASCPADPPDIEVAVDEDYALVRVVDDLEGANFTEGSAQFVPDDASITFRGADMDLIGISTPDFDRQNFDGVEPEEEF